MNREKTHLYKKQHQQPIEEETPLYKGKSKTAATSDSRKRSKHKHLYKKIILHYGSDSFAWGRQCEVKFAEEWILHINPLIGIQRSSK